MLDQPPTHSRMAASTLRRIATLALARTYQYAPRTIAPPDLVAAVPAERVDRRPNI